MFDDPCTISAYIEKESIQEKLIFFNTINNINLVYFDMDYIIEFFKLNGYSLERIKDECKEV